MTYEPIGERHAIQEVAFSVLFDRALSDKDIGRISSAKEKWSGFLPKEEQLNGIFMAIGGTPKDPPPPPPVSYARVNIDGSVAWRLLFQGNQITVSCAVYTRWSEVLAAAKSVLISALEAIDHTNRNITNFNLQIIDVFKWVGDPEDCKPDELFVTENPYFPEISGNFGALWHLFSGFFEKFSVDGVDFLENSRLLNRLHMDSSPDNEIIKTKLDHTLRLDLSKPASMTETLNREDNNYIDDVFNKMHSRNKAAIAELIKLEMQERISLNG